MLDIDQKPTFIRTARFHIPSGKAFLEQSCTVTFEALDIDEFNAFDLAIPDRVKALLKRVVLGLDDLVDKDGNQVAFTPAVLDRLLQKDWGRIGLVGAYIRGRQEAAEGN